MSVRRRAPKTGYAFPEKDAYRKAVWLELKKRCPVPLGMAQAMLMPSIEGTEIEVAKSFGFREENLHVVDFNPAIVATLKRRFPRVNTYGVSVERALERVSRSGASIHVANFDFTSCAGARLLEVATDMRECGGLHAGAVFAATVLRGRENFSPAEWAGNLVDHLEDWKSLDAALARVPGAQLTRTDALRVACVGYISPGRVVPRRVGVYRSGTQTMLWSVFSPATISRGNTRRKRARRARKEAEHMVWLNMATLMLHLGIRREQGREVYRSLLQRTKPDVTPRAPSSPYPTAEHATTQSTPRY